MGSISFLLRGIVLWQLRSHWQLPSGYLCNWLWISCTGVCKSLGVTGTRYICCFSSPPLFGIFLSHLFWCTFHSFLYPVFFSFSFSASYALCFLPPPPPPSSPFRIDYFIIFRSGMCIPIFIKYLCMYVITIIIYIERA